MLLVFIENLRTYAESVEHADLSEKKVCITTN